MIRGKSSSVHINGDIVIKKFDKTQKKEYERVIWTLSRIFLFVPNVGVYDVVV